MAFNCWYCGAILTDFPDGKVSFRATCDRCLSALHCCQNCKNYKIGLPNHCMIPGTEPIIDRSANNFCEDFSLLGKPPEKKQDDSKTRFDDLFK